MGKALSVIVYVCVEMVGHTRSAQGSASSQGPFVEHREGVDTVHGSTVQGLGVLGVHVRVIVQSTVQSSSTH